MHHAIEHRAHVGGLWGGEVQRRPLSKSRRRVRGGGKGLPLKEDIVYAHRDSARLSGCSSDRVPYWRLLLCPAGSLRADQHKRLRLRTKVV